MEVVVEKWALLRILHMWLKAIERALSWPCHFIMTISGTWGQVMIKKKWEVATSKRNVRICTCCQYASNNHLPHLQKPLLSFFQPLTQTGPAVASPGLWPASLLRFSNDPWRFDTDGSPFHWMLVRKITQLSNKVHLKVLECLQIINIYANRKNIRIVNQSQPLLVHRKCKMRLQFWVAIDVQWPAVPAASPCLEMISAFSCSSTACAAKTTSRASSKETGLGNHHKIRPQQATPANQVSMIIDDFGIWQSI